jgi:THAP4-like, heme-binding beta-barrel domain
MTDDSKPEQSTSAPDINRIELPPEHPAIAPFSFLLGRWVGTGKGDYPTIEPFDFFQEVTFSHIGKPYLIYTSRSWRLATVEGELARDENGDLVRLEPLAVEAGFWRPQPEGKVEVLLSHPTGVTEIYYGQLTGLNAIEMVTDAVARTETAKPYVAGKRLYGLVPNKARAGEKDLAYAFDMAAMGYPLTPHLWAVLQWDWIE